MSTGMSTSVVRPTAPHAHTWEMTLGDFLASAASRDPAKIFVDVSGQRLSYGQFQIDAARTASMFQLMGIGKGDRYA